MPQETPSPIDLPAEPLDRAGLGWTSGVLLIASLFLLGTNAQSLSDWIEDQPPGALQAQASELAGNWLALMRAVGVARPRDEMHAAWKRAEAARFHGGSVGEGRDGGAGAPDQR